MFSKDQLEQLRTVMREEIDKRAEQTDLKMDAHFTTLKKQQDQDRDDWSGFFHEVGIFMEEMKQKLLKRIERIEDHLNIAKN